MKDRGQNGAAGPQAKEPVPPKKKLYRKPDFVCEQIFETMALSCGKIVSTQQQCNFNRRTS